jgi:transcriptional repressor NrdR
VEMATIRVVKRDGTREEFDRNKIKKGIVIACEKRPVSSETIDSLVSKIENYLLNSGKNEIDSKKIGELVMKELKKIDEVAYIRFASVYRRFTCIDEFKKELEKF